MLRRYGRAGADLRSYRVMNLQHGALPRRRYVDQPVAAIDRSHEGVRNIGDVDVVPSRQAVAVDQDRKSVVRERVWIAGGAGSGNGYERGISGSSYSAWG